MKRYIRERMNEKAHGKTVWVERSGRRGGR